MAEKVLVDEVLACNKIVQDEARRMNVLCGESLFKVYSQAELQTFLMERLAGARNIAEVGDVEALRLPELEEELVYLVLSENPEKIPVLGQDMAVSYQNGAPPRVTITEETIQGRRWLELPDEGIKLPGGRQVEIVLIMGWQTVARSADISALKMKVREYLNQQQWNALTAKPGIAIPNPVNDAVFPEIMAAQYGKCVVTGEPLIGYGAIGIRPNRYYSSDPWFEVRWYWVREEAEKAHAPAAAKFAELRVQFAEKVKLEEAKKAAQSVQARVRELYNDSHSYDFGSSLRGELYDRLSSYVPTSSSSDLVDLAKWQTDAEQLIARVEAALVEVERKKADQEFARKRLTQLLERDYAVCPVCQQEGNSWTSAGGAVCYCVEYEQFSENEVVFRESVAADSRVLVRAELNQRRRSQYVYLNVLDECCPELSEVTTRIVWAPPSEEERTLKQQLRDIEFRLQDIARELDKCEGDHPSRILLKFEQDVSRGTLFAIAAVHELSVFEGKSGESVVLTGSVRFVCDPSRCGWLNVDPPKVGQSWICSLGKMIGRAKNMPIVIANPQIQDDMEAQKAIEAEMKDIEAKIAALRGKSLIPEAVAEFVSEQSAITEPKDEVTQDALEMLRAKFGK